MIIVSAVVYWSASATSSQVALCRLLPACSPQLRAFSRRGRANAEHQTTEKARPPGRERARLQPALALDLEDAHAASQGGCRGGRRERDRRAPPRARELARQGGR